MFRRLLAVTIALAIACAGSAADARSRAKARAPDNSDKWVLIATGDVDLARDTATIDATKAAGSYKALRIQARRQGIDLSRVAIVYGNGAVHNEDRRVSLRSGERSRAIDQRSEDRFVDTVTLTYKTDPKAKRMAVVDLYGLQGPEGRKAVRGSQPVAKGQPPQTGQITTSATNPEPIAVDPGSIVEGRDVMFGYQNVGFAIDRDKIAVGAEIGKFELIRLRVLENDIHIKELEVFYVNGTSQVLAVNADIAKNQKTKWFRVNGREFIKDVQLVYNSKPSFKGQARVEVLGQYAGDWLGPRGEGRKYNQGWVLLGSQTAGALGFDKDTVSVGQNEGGFSHVRLNVRDRSITLREVRVVYVNGPDEVIKMRDRLDPGQVAGPWDLKGDHAAIKEIVATYRTRLLFGKGFGPGVVEFWGQH